MSRMTQKDRVTNRCERHSTRICYYPSSLRGISPRCRQAVSASRIKIPSPVSDDRVPASQVAVGVKWVYMEEKTWLVMGTLKRLTYLLWTRGV